LGIFGPGYGKFMKRRVEAPMTIQMTSLTRAERAAERNCETDLYTVLSQCTRVTDGQNSHHNTASALHAAR